MLRKDSDCTRPVATLQGKHELLSPTAPLLRMDRQPGFLTEKQKMLFVNSAQGKVADAAAVPTAVLCC